MAYFPNGTAGDAFESQWCVRCINMPERDDRGCAVWLTHLLFAYEECNSKSNAKKMLDILIEPGDSEKDPRCAMFVDKTRTPIRNAADVELDEERERARPKLIEWPAKAGTP